MAGRGDDHLFRSTGSPLKKHPWLFQQTARYDRIVLVLVLVHAVRTPGQFRGEYFIIATHVPIAGTRITLSTAQTRSGWCQRTWIVNRSPQAEKFSIDGQAGQLECLLELPGNVTPRAIAVICHPHPLHGGTMQNKVVHTLSRAFVVQEFSALRFNFRGVGISDGTFDEGNGEKQDVLSAVGYMHDRFPELPLWLAGFSFGAAMAIRAARDTDIAGLVSIAPAAFRLADMTPSNSNFPWLIVHGENDELADINDTVEWVNSMPPGPELCVFPDTTHFFHGKLIKLREAVTAFVGLHAGFE